MAPSRTSYEQFRGFEHVYLEDSWVLHLESDRSSLVFDLDVVLTEDHPSYSPPGSAEQYCYRDGSVRFRRASEIDWSHVRMRPATGATGQPDFGNIDYLYEEEGRYYLGGDWGEVCVTSPEPPSIELS